MSAPQPLLSALLAAGTLFLTAGGAPAIPPVPQDTTGSEATPEGAPAGLTWPELLQRDARVSFTSRSAFEASLALNDPSSTSALRTAALMAIGCMEPQAVREPAHLSDSSPRGPGIADHTPETRVPGAAAGDQ